LRIHKFCYSQVDFTLVELVVVILILSILALTAAPYFVNISGDAKKATTAFEAAAFNVGINLVLSAFQIRQQSPVAFGNTTVPIDSTSNWPTGSGCGIQFCVNLWNSIVDTSVNVTGKSSLGSALSEGGMPMGLRFFVLIQRKRVI